MDLSGDKLEGGGDKNSIKIQLRFIFHEKGLVDGKLIEISVKVNSESFPCTSNVIK